MFTGIIESLGRVKEKIFQDTNIIFHIESTLCNELKIDQSVSHSGVCLTVTEVNNNFYSVTVVEETLKKTNFSELKTGDFVNLERSMLLNGRFDGHIVQGHVDQVALCESIIDKHGSWIFTFSYEDIGNITVEKGSVCVNGISLTVIDSLPGKFSVAIIPYTFENTNLKFLQAGKKVNLEFDIIGKYLKKLAVK